MNAQDAQVTYTQLLDRYVGIKVPLIQRNYVQGRRSEAAIRESFLRALHNALVAPADHPSVPLNLDFIYGVAEAGNRLWFQPLDGQQRLTTLLLLHWYLAWRDQRFEEFQQIFYPDGQSRFVYAVRTSSNDFFRQLVQFSPESFDAEPTSLSTLITDQPWYFARWRLDPTIQSCLVVLDALHSHFGQTSGLFSRLLDDENPRITFHVLNLHDFGLSDDLYIKMNARGMPLTAYETFKAQYEQALVNRDNSGEVRFIGNQKLPIAEYVARRLDTAWADLMWAYRDSFTNLFDEELMNIVFMVASLTRNPDDEDYLEEAELILEDPDSFRTEWMDEAFTSTFIALMDTWSSGTSAEIATQLEDSRYSDEHKMFQNIIFYPGGIKFAQRIQIAAYISFVRDHVGDLNSASFHDWMRVIVNLTVNTGYYPLAFQRGMSAVRGLLPESSGILDFLAGATRKFSGFWSGQISEERVKAQLLTSDTGWRAIIERAETHRYFAGQIGFLLDFCGVDEKRKVEQIESWGNDTHEELQRQFAWYLERAECMFGAGGLSRVRAFRWERALLCVGDYLLDSGPNRSFAQWKRLLRASDTAAVSARPLLKKLWDKLQIGEALDRQLDRIIAESYDVEPWQYAVANTPGAIRFCENMCARFDADREIYLLKRTQMNGNHVELFSYCKYLNLWKPYAKQGVLAPFSVTYQSVAGVGYVPAIFFWHVGAVECFVAVSHDSGAADIDVYGADVFNNEALIAELRQSWDFQDRRDRLARVMDFAEADDFLLELLGTLARFTQRD